MKAVRFAVAAFALSVVPAAPGFAQVLDGQVYEMGDYRIEGIAPQCGEARTIVARTAPYLIQEQNLGTEIAIDASRFDPLPPGVRLFIYYQTCTGMFFFDNTLADSYATTVGMRDGWLSVVDVQAICEGNLIDVAAWPAKPDAARCEAIYAQMRAALGVT